MLIDVDDKKEEKRVADAFKATHKDSADITSSLKSKLGDVNTKRDSSRKELDKATSKGFADITASLKDNGVKRPEKSPYERMAESKQEASDKRRERRERLIADRQARQERRQEKHEAYHSATNNRFNVAEKGISKEERDRRKQNIRTATLGEMMGGREDEALDVMKAKMKYDKRGESFRRGVANTASAGTIKLLEKRLNQGERKEAEEYYQANKSKGWENAGSFAGGLALYGGTAGAFEDLGGKAVGRAAATELGKRLGAEKLAQLMAGEGVKAAIARSLVGDAIQDSTIGLVDTLSDVATRDDLQTPSDYAKAIAQGQLINYGMGLAGNAVSHGLPVVGKAIGRRLGDFADESRRLYAVPKGVADIGETVRAKVTDPVERSALLAEKSGLDEEYWATIENIKDTYGAINPNYKELTPEEIADITAKKTRLQEINARRDEVVDLLSGASEKNAERARLKAEKSGNAASVDVPEKEAYNNVQEGIENEAEIGNIGEPQAGGDAVSAVDAGVSARSGLDNEAVERVADATNNKGRRGGNGTLRVSKKNRAKLTESGVADTHLSDVSDNYAAFSNALEDARKANNHGAWVDSQSVEDLTAKNAKTFLSEDGYAGVAVKKDGDICGVFKNPASKHKGAVYDLIYTARANGGTKMDCYGQTLANLYEKAGYKPVARIPFNPKYVDDAKLLEDAPDVYVLMKNTDNLDTVASKIGKAEEAGGYRLSTQEELDKLPSFEDYDEALAYRDKLLAEQEAGAKAAKGKKGKGTKAAKAETEPPAANSRYDELVAERKQLLDDYASKNERMDDATVARVNEINEELKRIEAAGAGAKTKAQKGAKNKGAKKAAENLEPKVESEAKPKEDVLKTYKENRLKEKANASGETKTAKEVEAEEKARAKSNVKSKTKKANTRKGAKPEAETLKTKEEAKAATETPKAETKEYEVQVKDSNGRIHTVTVEAESSSKARRAGMAKVQESLEHNVDVIDGRTLGGVEEKTKSKGAKKSAETLEPKAAEAETKAEAKPKTEQETAQEDFGKDYAVLKEKIDEAGRLRGRIKVAQGAEKEALQNQLKALEKEIQFDKDFAEFRKTVGNAKTDLAELENKLKVAETKEQKAAIKEQINKLKENVNAAHKKAGLRYHPDKGGSDEWMGRFNEEFESFKNAGKGGNAPKGKTPEPNRTVENVEDIVHKTKEQGSAKEEVKDSWQAARRSTTNSMVTFEDNNLKTVKTDHEGWKIRNALIDKARRFKALAVRSIDKKQLRADGTRYGGTVERIGADGKTYKIENGKSLKQIYAGLDETTEAKFDAYLLLRHAPDRIREATPIFKRINLVGEDGSVIKSLDDPEVVREYADKLLKENPDFARRAEEVYQYEQNELENRVRAGLLSQETASKWAHDHPFYVPTGRDGYFNAAHGNHAGIIGADSIKGATGSDLDIRSIKEQLAEATSRNWRDITTNGLLEEFFGSEVKAGRADTKGLQLLNETVGLSKSADGRRYYAKIFRDGEMHRVEIDKNYYLDLQDLYKNGNLGGDGGIGDVMDTVARATSKASTPFKKLVTTWNPIFLPKNFSRDMQDALINSRQTKEFVECLGPAWNELKFDGEYARAFQDSGVSQANFVNLEEAFNGKGGKLGKAVDKFIALQDMTESFPRLAEYMATLKKAGVDITKPLAEQDVDPRLLDIAAANAADVTVNFGRSGSVGKNLNKGLVPFLNPSIQGWSKFVRNFKEQKGTKQLLGTIAKAYALGAGVMAVNNFLLSDNPNYQQISNREKATNIIIPIPPFKDGLHINDDADTFIKIPRGRFATVYGLTTVNAFNENEMGWAEMIKVARDQVLPVDPTESSIVAPLYAAKKNETWYGAPIESDYLVENFSPSERYDERTTPMGKALGKATSGLPEELQISPKKFDYIADAATGVIGDFALPISTAIGNKQSVPEAGAGVLKKAFTIDSATQSGLSSEYNKQAERLTHKKNAANPSEEDKKAYESFNSWDSRVKAASNAMRYVQNSDMPNKQEAYRELAKLRNDNMQKALDGKTSISNAKDIDIIHKYAGTSYTIENLGKTADKDALKAYAAAVYGDLSESEMKKKIDSDTEFYKGYRGIAKTQSALQKVSPSLKGGNALTYAVGLADAGANDNVFSAYNTTIKSRTESASKAQRAKDYFKNNGSVDEFAQLENAVKNLGKLSDVDKGNLEDEAYAKLKRHEMTIDEYNTELKKIDYNANQSYVGKAVSLAMSGAPARAYNLYDIKEKSVQKGYNLAAMGIDSRKYREMSQACDKDGNGYLKTAEIRDYVANSDFEDKATLFDALCYYNNVRNPFGTPKRYSAEQAAAAGKRAGVTQIKANAGVDGTVFAKDSSSSNSGYGGYSGYRKGYGGYKHRGYGGSSKSKVPALKQSSYKASKRTYKDTAAMLKTSSSRSKGLSTAGNVKVEPPKVKFKKYEV